MKSNWTYINIHVHAYSSFFIYTNVISPQNKSRSQANEYGGYNDYYFEEEAANPATTASASSCFKPPDKSTPPCFALICLESPSGASYFFITAGMCTPNNNVEMTMGMRVSRVSVKRIICTHLTVVLSAVD